MVGWSCSEVTIEVAGVGCEGVWIGNGEGAGGKDGAAEEGGGE